MLTTILGGLASLAAIIGAAYGIFKWAAWKFQTTPEETKESIDQQVDAEEAKVKETGRPQ